MARIFSLFVVILSFLFPFNPALAVEAELGVDLSIRSVKVIDSQMVQVTFSEGMDLSSLVLKITRQSDNSSVNLNDIRSVENFPESVDVILSEDLAEGTSYSLTVLAAVSLEGATISDGAQALREFVTPSPLPRAELNLPAPPNPTVVTPRDDVGDITPNEESTPTPITPARPEPVVTEELPLTGVNPFFLLLLALPIALLFFREKQSH